MNFFKISIVLIPLTSYKKKIDNYLYERLILKENNKFLNKSTKYHLFRIFIDYLKIKKLTSVIDN